MSAIQIVILTILALVAIAAVCSWVYRMAELQDSEWIEIVLLLVVGLLAYLVATN